MKLIKLFLASTIILMSASANADAETLDHLHDASVKISGKIVDSRNDKSIANVNVNSVETNIGTVSNADGYFTLSLNRNKSDMISFSAVGYSIFLVAADSLKSGHNIIRLERKPVDLSEVVVYGGDPAKIVAEAIKKIPHNYSASNDLLSLFYRETIRKGRRFIGVSEAALDVFKTSYGGRDISYDRARIERGRRLVSQKSNDTIAVKIIGGPNLAICLDFVKNADLLFREHELSDFDFKMEKPEYIDEKIQYVVSFRPNVKRDFSQFKGILYIDCDSLTFTRAEFEMDPDDKAKMTAAILRKKPKGLRFNPQKIGFVVSYKVVDGKTRLNYIQNQMRFKCEMKRKLFASAYTVYTEMVVVDSDLNTDKKISAKESFKPKQVFYDLVDQYWDENFWSDFNIIAPTESLEHAVNKLKKNNKALSLK